MKVKKLIKVSKEEKGIYNLFMKGCVIQYGKIKIRCYFWRNVNRT